MTKREKEQRAFIYRNLQNLGFSFDDCEKLRRISLTLRRWYELECGTENDFGTSFAIEINPKDNKPYVRTAYNTPKGYKVRYAPTADKKTGAIKRLDAIIKPFRRKLCYYLQTDPRGAALYIVPFSRLRKYGKTKAQIDCCYSLVGICVY